MKAWIYRTSSYSENGWIEKIRTLKDLLKLYDKYGSIIVKRNEHYHGDPFPNTELWNEYLKKGMQECEIDIEIYDDYRE